MTYQFKIHGTDRNRSCIGQVEADDIVEAFADAVTVYKESNPGNEVVHITIEDAVVMAEREKQWAREQS